MLGRGEEGACHLPGTEASRRHAEILREGSVTIVRDLDSRNGVFVNGKRVESSVLEHGDEIVVGRHRLHFLVVAAVAPGGRRPTTASA